MRMEGRNLKGKGGSQRGDNNRGECETVKVCDVWRKSLRDWRVMMKMMKKT